jgi:hypothetical protein
LARSALATRTQPMRALFTSAALDDEG